ncbi:hypothetical protein O6H91_09G034500 [Diphasiastrum complanatum]|uniref:Uncharacterized protein n=2 Tax=Diphasiastrum complanatum TaxID=34168 RepID=A0ACC2CMW2_DIPCM|nr:hypothetical protein O6H91_09G034500 [Diphasiastrum complanatum]KAJ7543359.1 hypothetical protein O6H91_09G034500 [Diphasiastrum complanatum]
MLTTRFTMVQSKKFGEPSTVLRNYACSVHSNKCDCFFAYLTVEQCRKFQEILSKDWRKNSVWTSYDPMTHNLNQSLHYMNSLSHFQTRQQRGAAVPSKRRSWWMLSRGAVVPSERRSW